MKIKLLLLPILFSSAFNVILAAPPSLISSKNYGILWDNYSLTTAGDVRLPHPLSALQLFSKNGEQGWLNCLFSEEFIKIIRLPQILKNKSNE